MKSAPSRVLVYGVTGSGKTTLARQLGERLGVPWHPADDLAWEPGWVLVPNEVQRRRVAAICAGERWILDNAYGSWTDIPLRRADLVIGLDYPRWLSLGRLLRRCAHNLVRRTPVCNGNVETWRQTFSPDSIVVWHFKSFKRRRRRMRQWQAELSEPRILLFRSPGAVTAWLRGLR
ncbi:AAA family ATPase [Paractinoplanes rishiriensis]|uniref:AAA family ATPase n=1 Tax=Paractinoplanes rishiriensis TaxID=1050105 RepID=UPI001EF3CA51|nr:adenylate kinase [Actinoplanes rishiriensis]